MTRSGKRSYCRVSTPSHSPASGLSKLIGTVFLSSACGHQKESTCFITWWFRDMAAKLITPTFFGDGHCNMLPSLIAGRLTRPSPSQASDRPAISNGAGPSKLSWDSGSSGIWTGFRGLLRSYGAKNYGTYNIKCILYWRTCYMSFMYSQVAQPHITHSLHSPIPQQLFPWGHCDESGCGGNLAEEMFQDMGWEGITREEGQTRPGKPRNVVALGMKGPVHLAWKGHLIDGRLSFKALSTPPHKIDGGRGNFSYLPMAQHHYKIMFPNIQTLPKGPRAHHVSWRLPSIAGKAPAWGGYMITCFYMYR